MSFQQEAVREWVWEVGRQHKDRAWLLTDYDTWERNPHYTGPAQPHPEDEQFESHDFGPRGQQIPADVEHAAVQIHLHGEYQEEDMPSRRVQWLQQQDLDEDAHEAYHDSLERLCDGVDDAHMDSYNQTSGRHDLAGRPYDTTIRENAMPRVNRDDWLELVDGRIVQAKGDMDGEGRIYVLDRNDCSTYTIRLDVIVGKLVYEDRAGVSTRVTVPV